MYFAALTLVRKAPRLALLASTDQFTKTSSFINPTLIFKGECEPLPQSQDGLLLHQ